MPRKAERDRKFTIETSFSMTGSYVFPEKGWALPGRFTINATLDLDTDTPATIEIVVVTTEGERPRPRAERLSVYLEDGSVDSSTLRAVPVRDLLASGTQKVLMKVTPGESGGFVFAPPTGADTKEIIAVTKRAVGWLS